MAHIPDGYFKGSAVDLEKSAQVGTEYCVLRGCDPETGIPTRKTLEKLRLKDIADRLESVLGSIPTGKRPSKTTVKVKPRSNPK